ncbi:MAG: TMEM175 family protein [Gemmatimonadaceae bacterium]
MLQDAHERLRPILQRRDNGFRWRGKDISRIEGLSDAVFGFAVTLLVVSLEAPKTFTALRHLMHGFVSFGVCFALLLMIWHSQYIFFRRYALDDMRTFVLNAALLFVVAFYIYPLKFLFTVVTNGLTGYQEMDDAGKAIVAMQWQDWRPLMLIYGAGFVALYCIFALLYLHAWSKRNDLGLNELESYLTRGSVNENLLMVGLGIISLTFAFMGAPRLSGLTYALIGPIQGFYGARQGNRRKAIVARMDAQDTTT